MYELPLFPLNTVLFPGMPLRLHVFEERYKVMIRRLLTTNQTFGVTLIKSGLEAGGPNPEPFETGCTARIVQIEPNDDGSFELTAIGDERFRIIQMGVAQPYPVAYVEAAPLLSHHSMGVVRDVPAFRQQVISYLELLAQYVHSGENKDDGVNELPVEEPEEEVTLDLSQMELPDDPMMLANLSAALLQVPANEKQPILEADTLSGMVALIQRLYRREMAVLPTLINTSDEQAQVSAWAN